MRITRKIINYIKDLKKQHTQMFCTKHLKKEVDIGATGTHMSVCLKGKREATRDSKKNIDYKCIKSRAELETNIDGSKSIKALILE